ncbi:MAG: hypothetical protein IKY94_15545 [Lachnospiraceae bacterium]|nr:hypothetical protein [Lachnospiraceae bacterium]
MNKETNYEHYKNEIIKGLLVGGSCKFKKRYILKSGECPALSCSECEAKTEKWLDAPYEEPKVEIDWEKVPVDTPVYVSDFNIHPDKNSIYRYFYSYFKNNEEPFEVWDEGKASFTTSKTISYKYCSLVRKEDIEKYKKE